MSSHTGQIKYIRDHVFRSGIVGIVLKLNEGRPTLHLLCTIGELRLINTLKLLEFVNNGLKKLYNL